MSIGQPGVLDFGTGSHELATAKNTCTYYCTIAARKRIQAGRGKLTA